MGIRGRLWVLAERKRGFSASALLTLWVEQFFVLKQAWSAVLIGRVRAGSRAHPCSNPGEGEGERRQAGLRCAPRGVHSHLRLVTGPGLLATEAGQCSLGVRGEGRREGVAGFGAQLATTLQQTWMVAMVGRRFLRRDESLCGHAEAGGAPQSRTLHVLLSGWTPPAGRNGPCPECREGLWSAS